MRAVRARLWLVLAVCVILLMAQSMAHAFRDHEPILRAALEGQMDPEALNSVIAANEAQDIGVAYANQLHSEFHFDNATGPDEICRLWNAGVGTWFDEIVQHSAPKGDEKRELENRLAALSAFGRLTHAIEDFYSHSNAVEIWVKTGARPDPNLLLGDRCNPAAFPQGIQTGYFDAALWARQAYLKSQNPFLFPAPTGCPDTGPPAPYRFCHYGPRMYPELGLNKDESTTPEGQQTQIDGKPTPGGKTLYELAFQSATEATRLAWVAVHDRIVHKYEVDKSTDAECLFMKLAWGKDRTCHRLWKLVGVVHEIETVTTPQGVVKLEVELAGLEAHISWQPQPYPGPKAPEVYTKIEGTWTINGIEQLTGPCTLETPINAEGNVTGVINVVPESVPPEIEDIWTVSSHNELYCPTPDGPQLVSSWYGLNIQLAGLIFYGQISPGMAYCNPPVPQPLELRIRHDPVAGPDQPQHFECHLIATSVLDLRLWADVVVSLDTP